MSGEHGFISWIRKFLCVNQCIKSPLAETATRQKLRDKITLHLFYNITIFVTNSSFPFTVYSHTFLFCFCFVCFIEGRGGGERKQLIEEQFRKREKREKRQNIKIIHLSVQYFCSLIYIYHFIKVFIFLGVERGGTWQHNVHSQHHIIRGPEYVFRNNQHH